MRNINIRVSLNYLSETLNLNDIANLSLMLQKKYFQKHSKKDSIEHILDTIKIQLIHGDNFDLINSNGFVEYILKTYINPTLEIKVIEENSSLYNSILEIAKLKENDFLNKNFRKFIIETSNEYGYNFDAIQNYIFEEYNSFKKDFEKIIMK